MSHVVKQEIEFRDLQSLKTACAELGWTFAENKRTYAWFGRHMGDYALPEGRKVSDLGTCTHAIKVPGCSYEIGIIAREDGSMFAEWDFWPTGGLDKVMGDEAIMQKGLGGAVLKAAYGAAAAKQFLSKKGFRVVEDRMVDRTVAAQTVKAVRS